MSSPATKTRKIIMTNSCCLKQLAFEKAEVRRWEVGEGNEQARDLAGLILAE